MQCEPAVLLLLRAPCEHPFWPFDNEGDVRIRICHSDDPIRFASGSEAIQISWHLDAIGIGCDEAMKKAGTAMATQTQLRISNAPDRRCRSEILSVLTASASRSAFSTFLTIVIWRKGTVSRRASASISVCCRLTRLDRMSTAGKTAVYACDSSWGAARVV